MRLSDTKYRIADLYRTARIQGIEEAVIEMEWNGFHIDVPYLDAQAAVAREDMRKALEDLRAALTDAGIESDAPDDIWASPKQLATLLHEGLGLPPSPYWKKGRVKIEEGERKTDRTALEWLAAHCAGDGVNPQARRVVEGVMGVRRIGSSAKYLEKLPRFVAPDGLVHPVCGPAGDEDDRVGALTGRLGMKNPEAQQIPRDPRKDAYKIRRAFVAPPGELLVVRDYTSLEPVIFANMFDWLFGERTLLELTKRGQDIHSYNAFMVFGRFLDWRTPSGRRLRDLDIDPTPGASRGLEVFKEDKELEWYRDAIKAVWYKLQYGGTVHGFAYSLRDMNDEPVGEARAGEILGALYAAVPAVQMWQELVTDLLRRDGGICAIDGRYADYSALIARDDPRSNRHWALDSAVRKGQNHPAQAGGAHVMGCAMVDVMESRELRRLGARTELQVHDELRMRCPGDNAPRVSAVMDEIMSGAFPLKNLRTAGGTGRTWADCK